MTDIVQTIRVGPWFLVSSAVAAADAVDAAVDADDAAMAEEDDEGKVEEYAGQGGTATSIAVSAAPGGL